MPVQNTFVARTVGNLSL